MRSALRAATAALLAAAAVSAVSAGGRAAAADPISALDATICARPSGAPPTPTAGAAGRFDPRAVDPAAPWMAKLEIVEETDGAPRVWTCGATVVAPGWLATAAHCVARIPVREIRATLGARDLEAASAVRRQVALGYCHPSLDLRRLAHDIALLRLDAPLPSGFPQVRLATEAEFEQLAPGADAYSAGWARLDGSMRISPWLRRAPVRVVDPARSLDGLIEAAPDVEGPSLCVGESGAPLIADLGRGPALFGVFTSVDSVWDGRRRRMTEICDGAEARSYFTSLADYRLWMARVVAACERDPDGCVDLPQPSAASRAAPLALEASER